MKKIIFIIALTAACYSQCNESSYTEYYPDLQGCDLSDASLSFASLANANLQGADLSGAFLDQSSLADANLTGANLFQTVIVDTYCQGAIFNDIIQDGNGAKYVQIQSSNLTEASFVGADLTNGIFRNNNLEGVDFSSSKMGTENSTSSMSFYMDYTEPMDNILRSANLCNIQVSPNNEVCEPILDSTSYDQGFSAGVASIDTQSFYDSGYFIGYGNGVSSVDTQSFYDSGYDAGYIEGEAIGYDIGAATGDVNNDGNVDVSDIILTVNMILGLDN